MGWFKCKHPFRSLDVAKATTREKQSENFDTVIYNLKCKKCGALLEISYTECTGGVEEYLAELSRRRGEIGVRKK